MTPRDHQSGGLDDSYQIDAVVSLFAVLLVMLLALTAATAASTDDVQTAYRPTDPPGQDMTLRSLQVPYQLREFWLLQDDGVLRQVDLAAISQRLVHDPAGGRQETTIEGVDVQFETFAAEPGSYRLGVNIWDKAAGAWAVKAEIAATDPDALVAWAGQRAASIVILTGDDKSNVAAVSQALARGNRSGSLLIPRNPPLYAVLIRRANNFSAEGIFRAN